MKTDWLEHALCREHDPELWFPLPGERHIARQAVAICKQCPVITDCAEATIDRGYNNGIYAGIALQKLTASDRRTQLAAVAAGVTP